MTIIHILQFLRRITKHNYYNYFQFHLLAIGDAGIRKQFQINKNQLEIDQNQITFSNVL